MKVLVVGGAGYVGGAVTDLLGSTSHQVRVYDSLLYEESYRKPVEFVRGDVRDSSRLAPHLDWADAVLWLAALVGDGACALNPEISAAINELPVRVLADRFDGRIVFLSSCSVYGAQDAVLDETSPTGPLSVYAATKLRAERHLEGQNAITFRLGTLFGVGDRFSRVRLDLVVNTLTVRAHRQGQLSVFGGNQYRPLLHVRDAARAVVDALAQTETGVFNLHLQNVRIADLASRVREHFPEATVVTSPLTFQDARNYRISSEKARRMLGFTATESIDTGIEEIKELLVQGRLKEVDNPRYTNQMFLSMFNSHHLGPSGGAS